jgi:phosphate/sulfate permease
MSTETVINALTIAAGLFFAWTIGSHYTGATMGMAYGSGVIKSPFRATCLIAVFVIAGATVESHNVVKTVGTGITPDTAITPLGAMVMMLTAALVTAANTWMRWPVSTSQLAVFSVVGAALAIGAPIHWGTTIVFLCITWVATPIAAAGLALLATRLVDRAPTDSPRIERLLRYALLAASCYAAYTLGANNTGNGVGVLYGQHLMSTRVAGLIGGVVMAIGALTWGRPLLEKVGKTIIELDLRMGFGAKSAQGITAHTAALLGYPTSMNQALLGGMAGTAAARGKQPMDSAGMREIVLSWFFTPILAGIISFLLYQLLSRATGLH